MKKGFSLIELLAVIVILAIISIIAAPIVISIIDDANENIAVSSFKSIEKAVELYYSKHKVKDIKESIVFECNGGICKHGENILHVNGRAPEQGRILINQKGDITYENLVINGYNCYKNYKSYVCDKEIKKDVFSQNDIKINSSKDSMLFNYSIYGNTTIIEGQQNIYESVGEKTKNLLNIADTGFGEFDENGDYVCSAKMKSYKLDGLKENTQYTLSATIKNTGVSNSYPRIVFYYSDGTNSSNTNQQLMNYTDEYIYKKATSLAGKTVIKIGLMYNTGGGYFHIKDGEIQLEEGTATEYEPYGYKIPVKVTGQNLFNIENVQPTLIDHGYLEWLDDDHSGLIMKIDYTNGRNMGILKELCPELKVGDRFVFNFETNAIRQDKEVTYIYLYTSKTTYHKGRIYTCTQDMLDSNVYIYSGITENAYIKNIQFEIGENITEYQKYQEPKITNIYIDESLRKIGDFADYIDFKNQQVVRYVETQEDGSLKQLNTPRIENINLPDILINRGVNYISIDTKVSPSKVELEYYN